MLLRIACIAVTGLLALTGCSMMTSYNTWLLPDGGSPRQGGGAYYLPKHILVVTVVKEVVTNKKKTITEKIKEVVKNAPAATNGVTRTVDSTIETTIDDSPYSTAYNLAMVRKTVVDSRYYMNLGFNHSPTADDDIEVEYNPGGLLKEIKATSKDRTQEIIVNLTKAIFSTGRFLELGADDKEALATKVLQVAFDPFDSDEMWRANQQLLRFGYCIAFARDPRHAEPEGCPLRGHSDHHEDHHGWRGDVRKTGVSNGNKHTVPETGEGVFFRQPLDHKVQIFQKNAPKCRGWCPRWEGYALFANEGPLLRVDINRTIFVKRETYVSFGNDGVPTKVHVKKPSELVEFSLLPLAISKAIIEAPLDAITSKTTVIGAQQKQIAAQTSLLDSQTAYVDKLNALVKAGKPVPPGHDIGAVLGTAPVRHYGDAGSLNAGRSAEPVDASRRRFYQYCNDVGLDQGGCDDEWRRVNPY